jgi:hypothetical protein
LRAAGARSLVAKQRRRHAKDLFKGAESLRTDPLDRIASEQRLGLRKPPTWANFVFPGSY